LGGTKKIYVVVEKPNKLALCDTLTFALMLASLRKLYPRVHYTFPAFAMFCRGEEVIGSALEDLAREIQEILRGLSEASLENLVRLRSDAEFTNDDAYQWAHFRGRTFDREHTEIVPSEESDKFLSHMNLNTQASTMDDVYGGLLRKIASLAYEATQQDGVLKQQGEAHHLPPDLPVFPGQDPKKRAQKQVDEN
jgi:hypothetical protein